MSLVELVMIGPGKLMVGCILLMVSVAPELDIPKQLIRRRWGFILCVVG